jgi:hypothetical protein
MKRLSVLLLLAAAGMAAEVPTPEEKSQIESKLAGLTARVKSLEAKRVDRALIADVDIYRKAAEYIVRFPEEFFTKAHIAGTIKALDTGLERARELESGGGAPSWTKKKGRVVRGYYSALDGSVQPYALLIPEWYDGSKPVRLDVWQHGTARQTLEVMFITNQENGKPVPADQPYIQLENLGRTNVSYRWAGEADMFESVASVKSRYNIDSKRVLLRGHSMGGASSWHLGLHHPGKFAAIEASAGYTETKVYGRQTNLPWFQEAMLHYYDAVDYSLNAFNIPTVGYGGEEDRQLQASINIREQLVKEGFQFTPDGPFRWNTTDLRALFLVGPKTGHSWHPESKKISEAFLAEALKTAGTPPSHLKFVTYTTRFNECHWLTVDGLEKHYERAEVDAKRSADGREYTVTTKNISRLRFTGNGGAFTLDGQTLKAGANAAFEKKNGKWAVWNGRHNGLVKTHALQGPVDDAFMDPFLCVRGTSDPWNALAGQHGKKALESFLYDFTKWLRGDPRVKDDNAVTAADIAANNLILFGDPGSNSLIAKVIGKLPVKWTKTEIVVGDKKFSAAENVPVLVYPNPLNPKKYVVINSGHTFGGDRDFAGTNAMLYPRLADYSILSAKGDIVLSAFFNENWQF